MRIVAFGCIAFTIACASSGAEVLAPPTTCNAGSAFDGTQCRVFATRTIERMPTPWSDAGRAMTLELVIYRPVGSGPFPTVIFHHGSTGNGDNPTLFRQTYTNDSLAKIFAESGWQVLFPQRRGRGASDGVYDEGFEPDRSRYSCRDTLALAGLTHALDDAEVIYQSVRNRPDVDTTRLIVGGQSRGGILAIAHAARHPGAFAGVVNFVGGWIGESCADAERVNRSTFVGAAHNPVATLWLYGERDPFYSAAHSSANFAAFTQAGGNGRFHLYRRNNNALSGHNIINEPVLWRHDLEAFFAQVAPPELSLSTTPFAM